MTAQTLRPYQVEMIEQCRESLKHGKRRPVLVCPTGGGKSLTAAEIIRGAVNKHKKVLFLAPRRELIDQAHSVFARHGVNSGIIMAGVRPSLMWDVQIASFDTLHARAVRSEKMKLPPADIVMVDECFTGDTSILTEAGFIRFDCLQEGIKVAQYEDGRISFVEPTAYIQRAYQGPMVRIHCNRLLDLTMTPQHEVLTFREGGSMKREAVGEAAFYIGKRMKVAGLSVGEDRELTPWERFLIAAQADGSDHSRNKSFSTISFSFSKERKIQRFLKIMEDGGFRFSEVAGKCSRSPNVKPRRRFLVKGLSGASKSIQDHFYLGDMGHGFARKIIEEMVEWDGYRNKSAANHRYFSSCEKDAVDFYQAVAILAGYKTNRSIQVDNRKETFRDVHRLFIEIDTDEIGTGSINKELVPHDGDVYCVRVPSGNIIVSGKGKPLVVGNCHLSISSTRKEIIERYPSAIIIGLTATPARGDGRGLGEIYDDLVIGPTVSFLTQNGFLVPARYFCPSKPDLAAVKLNKDGDYQENYLGEIMDKPQLVGDIIDNWTKIAATRRTVVFCVNCAHSRHITEAFCRIGIRAEHLDGETPTDERKAILDRVRSGVTQVLCNVFVASYGLDIPELDCAVLARPTKNITLFLQTVGRVLRSAPGKVDALIIDHAGAVHENGYADEVQPWSLDGNDTVKERKKKAKEEGKAPKQIECRECNYSFSGRRTCPNCGFEMVPPSKDIPVHEADLVEVKRDKKKTNREMGWDEKQYFLAQLNQYATEHGYKTGWAANQYRNKTGVWPNDPRLKNVGRTEVSLDTKNWIKSQQIRYAHRRAP